jgi:hypothetical protein
MSVIHNKQIHMAITSTLTYIGFYPEGGLLRPLASILRWNELGPGKGIHFQHR